MKGVCLSKAKIKNIRHFEVINILQMFKSSDFRSSLCCDNDIVSRTRMFTFLYGSNTDFSQSY